MTKNTKTLQTSMVLKSLQKVMEKKEYLVEITYVESEDSEVITLKTDDLVNESISKKSFTINQMIDIKGQVVLLMMMMNQH